MTVPMAVAGGAVHGKGSDARGTPLSISYVACCTAVSPLALSAVSFAISDIHFPYPKVHLETCCTNLSFSPPTPHTPSITCCLSSCALGCWALNSNPGLAQGCPWTPPTPTIPALRGLPGEFKIGIEGGHSHDPPPGAPHPGLGGALAPAAP